MFPYGQTVTIVKRVLSADKDEYGNDEYTEITEDVDGCVVAPGSSSENIQFSDQLSTGITVYLPNGTDVGYLDAVIVNGIKYEVQGDPSSWSTPFSSTTVPIEVRGTRVTGVSA